VAYDGQGTPPKMPFWGSAFPDPDYNAPVQPARRQSMFAPNERRQSVFAMTDVQDPPRSTAIFIPKDELPLCPSIAMEDKQMKRKSQQPCYPCDAIAAILARKDL
jgi:hypothetical protein